MNQAALDVLLDKLPGRPVSEALSVFLAKDNYLLRVDANERSITHRFAMYLQAQFPALDVDCEYNRDGVDPKRIQHFSVSPELEDTEAKTVFPDIIVHARGTDRNHLVIELKKTTNRVDREFDLAKLRGYKRSLHYEFALFIELRAGDDPDLSCVKWILE